MNRIVPSYVIHALFALAVVVATYPVWGRWLFGFNPTLDDLLRIRCFG